MLKREQGLLYREVQGGEPVGGTQEMTRTSTAELKPQASLDDGMLLHCAPPISKD
jgi:hypothetical protein